MHNGDRMVAAPRQWLAVIIVIIAIKRCRDERGLHADPVSRNASGVRRAVFKKRKRKGGGDNLGGYGVGRGESLIKTGPSINLEKDVAGELFYLRNFSRYRCK